jgi:diacylglycerol kinase (ATP)
MESCLGTVERYTKWIAPYQQPVLIYNPVAGKLRRDTQRILQRTTEALVRANIVHPHSLTFEPTSGPNDATRIARQAAKDGFDLILVLGGDGTINEVVNGMVHSNAALGILPGGTANVLAMELGLGSRVYRAIERLAKCEPRRVSVGRVCGQPAEESRHFLAMTGAGLDARIVYDINPRFKAMAGKVAYWVTGFAHATQSVGQFDARINGDTYRCGFALASRVRNYGGDLEIASGASLALDDFEIILFEGSNPLRYLWYMLGVGTKRVKKMAGVHAVRCTAADFASLHPDLRPSEVHLQIDGEYAGRLPARIEIVPAALTLLMPPEYR